MAKSMTIINEPYYKPILNYLKNNHIYYPKYSDDKYIMFLSGEDKDFMTETEYFNMVNNYITPQYFTKFCAESAKFAEDYLNNFKQNNKQLTEIQQIIDFNQYKYDMIYCILCLDNMHADKQLFDKLIKYFT